MLQALNICIFISGITFAAGAIIHDSIEIPFLRTRLVPNVIPKAPSSVLPIFNHHLLVAPHTGVSLRPIFFNEKPCIPINVSNNSYSTLIVYDASACCLGRNVLWMWKNMKLHENKDSETEYYRPKGCGKTHCILYLVYQHVEPLDYDLTNLEKFGQNATKFNLKSFIEHYGLSAPTQGNFLYINFVGDDANVPAYVLLFAYMMTITAVYVIMKFVIEKYMKN